MKRFFFSLLTLIYLFVDVAQSQPPQQISSNEQELTWVNKLDKKKVYHLLYLPDNYESQSEKKWPVLIYLHGADARSFHLHKVKQEGVPYVLRTGTKLPFVVAAPLCLPDDWWNSPGSSGRMNAFLDHLLESYRVDSRQIYLTGWSMGGAGTWKIASDYPHRFAAIAPLSGKSQTAYTATLQTTPIWAWHGAEDKIVPVSEAQKMVDVLKKNGGDIRLTLFQKAGHEVWQQVYSDPNLYNWLLQHPTKDARQE